MNTQERKMRYLLKRTERSGFMSRLRGSIDYVIEMSLSQNYKGENPAIRAVYSPLRISLLAMLVLFVVVGGVGSTVPIESAAVASGTVVVLSNKKTVQHLEGGIIRNILVKEGDLVKEGQPLLELNDVAPKASQTIVQGEVYAARVAEARLLALKENLGAFVIPAEIQEAAKERPELQKVIATQTDLFLTQQQMRDGKIRTLNQRKEQYNEEIVGLEAQVRSADGQLSLIKQEVEPMERLVEKGFAAKPQLLAIQRKHAELVGNRGQYIASIAKAKQSITETQMQISNTENEFATQNTDELKDVQSKLADLEEKLRTATDVMSRTVIVAPYEGVVTGLKYHTVGGVIAPGTPIMEIIPQNELLIVEAQVKPSDIDMLKLGSDTKISLSAYKTRSLPRLDGKVTYLSADTSTAQQGLEMRSFYTARVEINAGELARVNNKVRLYPGMPVEVFIHTGSRSFLGYIFAPIVSSLYRAFKED